MGATSQAFKTFLTTAQRFEEAFAQENRANEFAHAIRNGLLHDGETRRGWTIRQGTSTGPIVEDVGSGLIRLYRSPFHEALKDYVAAYFERLRAEDGVELRENLSNRIEQLCKDSVPSGQWVAVEHSGFGLPTGIGANPNQMILVTKDGCDRPRLSRKRLTNPIGSLQWPNPR